MISSLIGILSPRSQVAVASSLRAGRRRVATALPSCLESLEIRALLATVAVHVFNSDFSTNPPTGPVADPTIHVGDTVHWVWDEGPHSTTSVTGQAESWDSTARGAPSTFDHTFTHAGTFTYYCSIHGADNHNGTATGMAGTITVLPATTLTSIAVTPTNPSIAAGTTEPFTAMGTFSDGSTQDLTTEVTWASGTPDVASISNAAGSQGLATGLFGGTSTITATLGTVSGATSLTVTPSVLQSIAVSPTNSSVAVGRTRQFIAMGTFSGGTTQDITSLVAWASSNAPIATISNTIATQGLTTGLATGTSTISATLGTITGSTLLTVTPAPTLSSIMVMPNGPSILPGATEQFMAMGIYSDGWNEDLTGQVSWTSSDTSVAAISSTPGSQGMASGLAPGTTSIGAQFSGVTGSTVLTVSPPPAPLVTMTSVRLVLNRRHQVTQIIVGFSGAVSLNDAASTSTYRLATAGRGNSFDARNAGIIKLKPSIVNTSASTFTLVTRKALVLSKTVQFRVDGLHDSLGRLIDGNRDGAAGGSAIALLTRKQVILS